MAEQVAHVEPRRADADVQVTALAVVIFVARQGLGVEAWQGDLPVPADRPGR